MSTTRLLVLGLAYGRETTHGYAIHQELVSWGADRWAHVKWGSIYHALRQLKKEGKLESSVGEGGGEGRCRTDYSITPAGRAAFLELLRGALSDAGAHADLLSAGLAFLTFLSRAEAVDLLERRCEALRRELQEITPYVGFADSWEDPGAEHIPEMLDLWYGNAEHALRWTAGLIERLRGGAYTMADDRGAGADLPGGMSDLSDGLEEGAIGLSTSPDLWD
ncbi:DNA-binding transcriptional regulator, PadR family [Sinosporangium album]|uniref:DNA-binding transcriptional regulator, PadR family n=1 Tax=Sinosporangium album TaxID=504805 RepID=A0A1G8GQ70_9ACTN|nr:PadR family transcriptional regulator [Sinosporangium album]SDH96575.1 DNA-binding transcriptional regulator, PadR family [Sinosporangium album]